MIPLRTRRSWHIRRPYVAVGLVCCCAIAFTAGCQSVEPTGPSPSAQQSKPAGDQTPQNAEDADLKCWVSAAKITYAFDSPPDGRLVNFQCRNSNGKPVQIELATRALQNGKIITRDFGTIQMKMAGSGVGGISSFTGKQTIEALQSSGQAVTGAIYYMAPSQIREIRSHLGWTGAAASAVSASPELSAAGINTKDADGKTALMRAAGTGNSDRVKALIAAGADVNAKDNDGKTALFEAANKPDLKSVIELIAAHANVNAMDKYDLTALTGAVLAGSADCVKALIAAGANVNLKGNDKTPLMDAAEYNKNADCIKVLIAAGAAVNAKSASSISPGATALIIAVWNHHLEAVEALIAARANVNVRDDEGKTALAYAISSSQPDPAIIAALKTAGGK